MSVIIKDNFRIVEFQTGVDVLGFPVICKHIIDDGNKKYIQPKNRKK